MTVAKIKFVRNSPGIAQILRTTEFGQTAAAQRIAARVAAETGADVVVDSYVTDRRAASVTVRDVRARGWQARDGILTRAAAAAGLEVTGR